jgi:DNA replication protein DnaC
MTTAFDPLVRPPACLTDGCTNEPEAFVIKGSVHYSPICSECQEKAEVEGEREFVATTRAREDEAKWRSMGIPKLFFPETFSSFVINQHNSGVSGRCLEYAERFVAGETTGGLIILGPCGVGKSHLAVAILKKTGGFMVNEARLLEDIRAEYARDWEKAKGYMARCLTEPLVVLDDFASENRKEGTMTWLRDIMYRVTNERYEEKLPTIVTTNTTLEEFKARTGGRVVSRLMSSSEILLINDTDHRMEAS